MAPIGTAFAQTAGTAGPVTINDLFTADGVGLLIRHQTTRRRRAQGASAGRMPGG